MNIPIYEAYLNDGDEIQLISLVDKPAIERDFVAFNKEEVKQLQYFNDEQQMIVAPVMIPDKLILRHSDTLGHFYTKFSKDTIEKIRYQYSKDGNFNNTNLNHKDSVDGLIMLESWIKESKDDKSNSYGFSDLPNGTWFVKYKVDNKEVWQKIKEGKINGVSIEGYISYAVENFKKKDKDKKENYENILIDYFSNCGITQQQFEEEFAQADLIPYAEGDILPKDNKKGRTFYRYVGPPAQRDFCTQMLSLRRLYTYEEVKGANNLAVNAGFGPEGNSTYDIWFYKGGPNCKHYWQKIFATLSTQQSKGPARGKAGTPMYDQPNRGYLKAQVLSIFDKINLNEAPPNDGRPPDGGGDDGGGDNGGGNIDNPDDAPSVIGDNPPEGLPPNEENPPNENPPNENPPNEDNLPNEENQPSLIDESQTNSLTDIFGYKLKYAYLSPQALIVFRYLKSLNLSIDDQGMVRSSALQLDAILELENKAIMENSISPQELNQAILLVDDFKDLMNEISRSIGIGLDASFVDNHIEIIKSFANNEQFVILPKAGESKDEYIGRCVAIEVNNGYATDQAAAICYNKWNER
jgi:hypothetical protein